MEQAMITFKEFTSAVHFAMAHADHETRMRAQGVEPFSPMGFGFGLLAVTWIKRAIVNRPYVSGDVDDGTLPIPALSSTVH